MTLVIDVGEIDRLRCSMERLIDVRMEESASCGRPRRHLDLVIGCKRDLGKSREISMIDGARWDCKGVSIVVVFGILLMVSVDGWEYPSQVRFHCRCGRDCIVGSLVVSARRVFSGCSLDTMGRDLAKSIDAKPDVASAEFVRSYRNY